MVDVVELVDVVTVVLALLVVLVVGAPAGAHKILGDVERPCGRRTDRRSGSARAWPADSAAGSRGTCRHLVRRGRRRAGRLHVGLGGIDAEYLAGTWITQPGSGASPSRSATYFVRVMDPSPGST
jgi:hypothetical protein